LRAQTLELKLLCIDNLPGEMMKNKYQVVPHDSTAKKPAKAKVSDTEFRRRLKNISDWRKKRLDQLRTEDSR
jgi:hypothetical protein